MKCQNLDQVKFDEQNARLRKLPLLAPGPSGSPAVRFQFNLAASTSAGSLFVIHSARTRRAVYRGTYSPELLLPFAASLLEDKGFDQLRFILLQSGNRISCIWLNDRAEAYWQDRAQIRIDFLERVETDETGLRRAFTAVIAL